MTREVPRSADEVWARVCEFAEDCKAKRRGVPTLQEQVINRIKSVEPAKILRHSDKGRKNTTPVTRSEIKRTWAKLVAQGYLDKPITNYFTLALLQAALSDIVDDLGQGRVALRGRRPRRMASPMAPDDRQPVVYAERATERRTKRGRSSVARDSIPEGETHWRLKHYIRDEPGEALQQIQGGPWLACGVEISLPLPTADRVDVVVKSQRDGRRLLIEVKPEVRGTKTGLGMYAQAAKYRAIWRVLHGLDDTGVRCALAAPTIPRGLAGKMLEDHGIESIRVKVPDHYQAPPRED